MKIEFLALEKIKRFPGNPRKNEKGIVPVSKSLEEFGWQQPIVVDTAYVIIVGHTRHQAAESLGMGQVPVLVADNLTPDQVKAYRIADNKTAEFSEWDMAKLRIQFNELKASDYDVSKTGFSTRDVSILGRTTNDGHGDIDEIPEEVGSRVKPGELWALGTHRLMCGSALEPENYDRLTDIGGKIDMILTDPPYNVNYEGATKDKLKIQNDNMADGEFYRFLLHVFSEMKRPMREGAPIYVFYASSEGLNFYKAFRDSGFLFKQELVWVKNSMVLGRQDYQWQHEPIMYGWKPGAAHRWYGEFDKTTVIDDDVDMNKLDKKELIKLIRKFQNGDGTTIIREDKPTRNREHPTMKPIALVERFIKNSSQKDDIVLDPFGGSGSTLMACEKHYRSCRTMELDPKYCDVIIKRWEKYTGQEAKRISWK